MVEGLDNPWNIRYGPDDMLWVTERTGKRIVRVNPETGIKKVALTIDEARAEGQHFAVLGMAWLLIFCKKIVKIMCMYFIHMFLKIIIQNLV